MGGSKISKKDLESIQIQINQLKANDDKKTEQISRQAAQITQLQIQRIWDKFVMDKQHDLEQSNRLGVEFIHSQLTAHIAVVTTTMSALFVANTEYNGIIGLKDAGKFLSVDLLISFASIALPGLGPIKDGIEEWEKTGGSIKKFIAHVGGSASDYNGMIQSYKQTADADDSSLSIAASSNNVIRAALLDALNGFGQVMIFSNYVIPYVIKKNFTEGQIKSAWVSAGLPILNGTSIGQNLSSPEYFDLMEKVFLYDMLENYTRLHVTYTIKYFPGSGSNIPANNLPEDGNEFGSFSGMTQATRDSIYARFGGFKGINFRIKTSRPVINGYRDMVREWGLKVT